jgi:hypothetical protein
LKVVNSTSEIKMRPSGEEEAMKKLLSVKQGRSVPEAGAFGCKQAATVDGALHAKMSSGDGPNATKERA